jgi:hypothetical protein
MIPMKVKDLKQSDYNPRALENGESREKLTSPQCPILLAKIADFGLNYCVPKENAKSATSGRKRDFLGQSLSYQVPLFPLF